MSNFSPLTNREIQILSYEQEEKQVIYLKGSNRADKRKIGELLNQREHGLCVYGTFKRFTPGSSGFDFLFA